MLLELAQQERCAFLATVDYCEPKRPSMHYISLLYPDLELQIRSCNMQGGAMHGLNLPLLPRIDSHRIIILCPREGSLIS